MEKIKQPIRKKFSPVVLYLDDLIKIINTLEEEKFEKIKINTTTHKYNKDELSTIPDSENISEIIVFDPFYLSINFNNSFGAGVSIYSDIDSSVAEGIIQKIGKILLKRRRKIFSIISKYWFALLCQVLIILLAYLLKDFGVINELTKYLMILGAVIIYIFLGFLDSGKIFKKNIFYYKNINEKPNFWTRKKDDLIINIIVAVISIILTIIATKG